MRLTARPCRRPDVTGTRLEVIAENQTGPRALDSQARRAKRWEDVARLTTGIAADLRGAVDEMSEPVHGVRDAALDENGQRHAAALQSAFGRARDLSRQLVAFGRRGAKAPETLDVNAIVRELEPVMRRLIDEHIELALELAPSLELVEAERSVLEEALVNLAVGAGDTLPAGGRMHVTTANVEITTTTADAPAGEYVALTVTARGWGASTSAPAASSGAVSAQKAMARLGGTLKVDAVADESVTFTVYLPQALVSISTDDLPSAAGQEAVRS
jgi:signal transduction histidine kinase